MDACKEHGTHHKWPGIYHPSINKIDATRSQMQPAKPPHIGHIDGEVLSHEIG